GVGSGHALLAELDTRLRELAVVQPQRRRVGIAEDDVELREAEREAVVLVDQRDANLVGDGVGEPAGELQPSEPGSEDDDVLHAANPTLLRGALPQHPAVPFGILDAGLPSVWRALRLREDARSGGS